MEDSKTTFTDGQIRLRELLTERGATKRIAGLCEVAHSTISRLANERGRQPAIALAISLSNEASIPIASWVRPGTEAAA